MKNYKKLELINKKTGIMESIAASLMWDKETYMPVGSISEKAEQLSLINDMVYDMFVGSDMSVLLQKSKTENLDNWQLRNHALTKKILLKKKCVDPTLLSKFTKISSLCCQKWKEARKKQDFSIVEPLLSEVINLAKEINKSKANALGIGLYDAALDSYNPQSKSVDIDNIFNELQPFLSKVISENSNKKFQYFDKSLSFGQHEMRDGVQLSSNRKRKPLISTDDLAALEPLECYISLPTSSVSAVKMRVDRI